MKVSYRLIDSYVIFCYFSINEKNFSVCPFYFYPCLKSSMPLIFPEFNPLHHTEFFSTFSAESLQKNKSSIEIAAEKSREPDFDRFSVKAAYGLSDKLEFNLTVPYVYHFADNKNGLEDVAVGFKYRFYDEEKYGPSLAYLINASIQAGTMKAVQMAEWE